MVWFFLIPSIPNTLGQFRDSHDDRGEGPGLSQTQPAELVHLHAGRHVTLYALFRGGVDTGWTFYTPFSTSYSTTYVISGRDRHFYLRLFLHHDRSELHRYRSPHAGARADLVPPADLHLVALRHQPDLRSRYAGSGDHTC